MEEIKNTADEIQVKKAQKKAEVGRVLELSDIRFLLQQHQFQRFLWRVIGYCGVFETPAHVISNIQNQNIGRGDIGRFLMAEINDADSKAFVKLIVEANK